MIRLLHGDCRALMADMEPNSVDAVVCDPPYELGFMGKSWDSTGVAFDPATWAACWRVLKPGGHLIAFGGTRTVHRIAVAIEDAQFEIRDTLHWCYWSGFPKSLNISKSIDSRRDWSALDALQGAVKTAREALGISQSEAARRMGMIPPGEKLGGGGYMWFETGRRIPTRDEWPKLKDALSLSDGFDAAFQAAERAITGEYDTDPGGFPGLRFTGDGLRRDEPATAEAVKWDGFGTGIKPAVEPAILARKPISETSIARNVLKWGTGALNIDGCRFKPGDLMWPGPQDGITGDNDRANGQPRRTDNTKYGTANANINPANEGGRFPANLLYSPKASRAERERGCEGLPAMSGADAVDRTEGSAGLDNPRAGAGRTAGTYTGKPGRNLVLRCPEHGDSFRSGSTNYNCGCRKQWAPGAAPGSGGVRNHHPTVKPIRLMQYLVRLVGCQPGSVILDPFMGSGSTGIACVSQGYSFIGCELSGEYLRIARARIGHAAAGKAIGAPDIALEGVVPPRQVGMF